LGLWAVAIVRDCALALSNAGWAHVLWGVSAKMGNYIGLSEVDASIWELIKTPQDIDAVCRAIAR
jgi:hypothetical protein